MDKSEEDQKTGGVMGWRETGRKGDNARGKVIEDMSGNHYDLQFPYAMVSRSVRSEVLMVLKIQIEVFWVVMLCSVVVR